MIARRQPGQSSATDIIWFYDVVTQGLRKVLDFRVVGSLVAATAFNVCSVGLQGVLRVQQKISTEAMGNGVARRHLGMCHVTTATATVPSSTGHSCAHGTWLISSIRFIQQTVRVYEEEQAEKLSHSD